ncbi:major facilitator superfamily domain-containing protein 6-A-like [Bolinopsis microptera]|uniref:major facilitator superfamily domain-containing protein 6-A-like n=1 Tax=Bolinopsis microptera TaxID=2820187 RepID=UPI003078E1B5
MIDEFLKLTTIVKDYTLGAVTGWYSNNRLHINNRELCLCLILNFTVWSTIGSLLPYLPVFYRSIGLSAEQTGFVIALKSLIGGVSCIFWGAFADKFQKRKAVFILSILSWTLFAACMTIIPPNAVFKSMEVTSLVKVTDQAGNVVDILNGTAKCYEGEDTGIGKMGECSKNSAKGYASLTGPIGDNGTKAEVAQIIEPTGGTTMQTFALSLVTVSVWSFFGSASAPLLDDIVFRIIPRDHNTYGRFRSVGSLGYGIAALIVGVFVKDYILTKSDVILTPDYRPSFYFTIASSLVSVVAVLFIQMEEEGSPLIPSPPKIPILKNKRLLTLLGTVFCLGMCHNMIQNFLLWYIEDIDGSHICMGIVVLTEHLSEIPFFFFGEYAIKTFGHTRLIASACIVYAFRFLSYSIISKPWLIVPLEIGNGVTLALMWSAAASYVCQVTPQKHQATTLGLLGGLHFQLGHFLSAILAGEFITHAGFKAAWWIYATFILGIGALYVTADTLLPEIDNYEELEGDNVGKQPMPSEIIEVTNVAIERPTSSVAPEERTVPVLTAQAAEPEIPAQPKESVQ